MITITDLNKLRHSEIFRGFEGVDGPTPLDFCNLQIERIPIDYNNPNQKILLPAVGHGTYAYILYWKFMVGLSDIFIDESEKSRHILKNVLFLNEINPTLCKWLQNDGFKVLYGDFFELDLRMKFDVVLGNPAWHSQKPGNKKTQPIWHKFVKRCLELCKDGGFLSLIHPTGWRDIDSDFSDTRKELLNYKFHYLSLHSEKDSQKIFNVQSCFDWYVLEKSPSDKSFMTLVRCMNESTIQINLVNRNFIPNGDYEQIDSLIACKGDERVNLIFSYSDYETRKPHMSKIQTAEYTNPCVSNINKDGSLTLYYSNTTEKGHFGIPKLICGKASSGTNFYIDYQGEYGLTQYGFAIVETPENLEKIKKALTSKKFMRLSQSFPRFSQAINHKMIANFKKDFWKSFIDE